MFFVVELEHQFYSASGSQTMVVYIIHGSESTMNECTIMYS